MDVNAITPGTSLSRSSTSQLFIASKKLMILGGKLPDQGIHASRRWPWKGLQRGRRLVLPTASLLGREAKHPGRPMAEHMSGAGGRNMGLF